MSTRLKKYHRFQYEAINKEFENFVSHKKAFKISESVLNYDHLRKTFYKLNLKRSVDKLNLKQSVPKEGLLKIFLNFLDAPEKLSKLLNKTKKTPINEILDSINSFFTFPQVNLDLSSLNLIMLPHFTLLNRLKSLNYLSFCNNQITDISLLPKLELKSLKFLTLKNNKITTMPPALENLESLIILFLDYNKIKFIRLLKAPQLRNLSLTNNNLLDISGLRNLQLKFLYLDNNPIKNISPLNTMKSLEKLSLKNTLVSEKAINELKHHLPNCKIVMPNGNILE